MAEEEVDPELGEEEDEEPEEEADPVNEVVQVMEWIGFATGAQAQRVANQIGDSMSAFRDLAHADIKTLTENLRVLPAAQRIHVNVATAKNLKAVIDWAKDCDRVNEEPSIGEMTREEFLEVIREAAKRDVIRKAAMESAETMAKEASPGKLTGEKVWDKWRSALENQLSMIFGVNGIPLVYVIREHVETPNPQEAYESFTQECIAKCRLEGPEFVEDSKHVHQIIQSLVVGEDAEQWVKDIKRYKNGRRDYLALVAHFTGEGNNTRRISDAERLFNTLHYKDERAMAFQAYLAKVKHMFNIFEEVGEPKTETAKIRFLMDTIKNTSLQAIIQAIKAKQAVDAESYTFTNAANLIASQLSKDTTRSVSGINTAEGKVKTEYLPAHEWRALTAEQKKAILDARPSKPGKKGRKGDGKKKDKQIKKLRKQVAALKRNADEEVDEDASASDGDGQDPGAGNAFGGREEKKNQKKKAKKDKP
jgi:hypothetical protein